MTVQSGDLRTVRTGGARAGKGHRALVERSCAFESGLDLLCFAIVVAKLEDELGVDPFTASEDVYFPVTLGEFVKFYEAAAA